MTMLALLGVAQMLSAGKINGEQANVLNSMANRPLGYSTPMFSLSRSRRIKNKRLRARK